MPVLFSRACEYALRALIEMARDPNNSAWTIQDLAARTKTPAPFLAKTLQMLVRNQVLKSTKGRGGGFSFLRPMNKITLLEIVHLIDGPALSTECALGLPACNDAQPCAFHHQWSRIRDKILRDLKNQTLSQLARKKSKP